MSSWKDTQLKALARCSTQQAIEQAEALVTALKERGDWQFMESLKGQLTRIGSPERK